LYTDETDNSIYVESLQGPNNKKMVFKKFRKPPQNSSKSKGLEGLEINGDKNYLYALREKNTAGNESYIYCFSMTYKDNVYIFTLEKQIKIELHFGQRYTDLTLSADKKRLYLLRSKKAAYYIDTIPLDENGVFTSEVYDSVDLTSIDISTAINSQYKKGFNTNLEGIVAYKNSLFLVSDNKFGNGNCSKKGDKTLLVEIKL
jgi:hypothetical protein